MIYQELIEFYDHQKIIEMLQKKSEGGVYKSYLLLCLFSIIRISFTFICMYIGLNVLVKDFSSVALLTAILLADFIFIIPGFIKLIWFNFIIVEYSLNDIKNFPDYYSAAGFIDSRESPWLSYPLHLFNFFEICYWTILAYKLKPMIGTFWQSVKFVSLTYGVGIAIWILLVMFLILSFS